MCKENLNFKNAYSQNNTNIYYKLKYLTVGHVIYIKCLSDENQNVT